MTKEEIIGKIMIRMDELTPFNTGMVISSRPLPDPVEGYIASQLPAAWRSLILRLPVSLLPAERITGGMTKINKDLSVSFTCRFIRVIAFKMRSWEKEVNRLITPASPLWVQQFNPYTRGSIYKPVAALTGEGEITAYCAANPEDELEYCSGAVPLSFEEKEIALPAALQEAFYCEAAGCVYVLTEQPQQAQTLFALADRLIGNVG